MMCVQKRAALRELKAFFFDQVLSMWAIYCSQMDKRHPCLHEYSQRGCSAQSGAPTDAAWSLFNLVKKVLFSFYTQWAGWVRIFWKLRLLVQNTLVVSCVFSNVKTKKLIQKLSQLRQFPETKDRFRDNGYVSYRSNGQRRYTKNRVIQLQNKL